jgi:hypothetical protein
MVSSMTVEPASVPMPIATCSFATERVPCRPAMRMMMLSGRAPITGSTRPPT